MALDRTTELARLATAYSYNGLGFRNRLINGDFRIDQRNGGASYTPTGGIYTIDRWYASFTQSGKVTVGINLGAGSLPPGCGSYYGMLSTSAYSVTASDSFGLVQAIEGANTADFGWGTANAVPITVSFWAYSSLTGNFGGIISNASAARNYPFLYNIPVANTWTKIRITIPGDTSGTWSTAARTAGIFLRLSLGVGSTGSGTPGGWSGTSHSGAVGAVSLVGTNAAVLRIAQVQLEPGLVDTPFDMRDIASELYRCQRYFYRWTATGNYDVVCAALQGSGASYGYFAYPQAMYQNPVFGYSGGFGFGQLIVDGTQNQSGTLSAQNAGYGYSERTNGTLLSLNTSGLSTGVRGYIMAYNSVGASIFFDADL